MRMATIRWVAGFLLAASVSGSQEPGLRIVVLDGEDGVNIIDKKTAVKPLVEVRDKNDIPVAGAIVTFVILEGQIGGKTAAFASNAKQLTVATNTSGRATVSQLQPVGKGAFKIQVRATYQGQTTTTTINQTNFATLADAAKAGKTPGPSQSGQSGASSGGSSAGSGAGGASSAGGLSSAAIGGIAAGAAGAAVATAVVIKNRNSPPTIASVLASPTTGLLGSTTISFSAQASDPDNNTLTYSWDFGDGGTSTATTPTHIYHSAGSFTIKLTVSDGKASVSSQTTVTIQTMTATWRSSTVQYNKGTIQWILNVTQSDVSVSGSAQGVTVTCTLMPCLAVTGTTNGSIRTTSPRVTLTASVSNWGSAVTFSVDPSSDVNIMTGMWGDISGTAPIVFTRQ